MADLVRQADAFWGDLERRVLDLADETMDRARTRLVLFREVRRKPELAQCTPASLIECLATADQCGLSFVGGDCAMVPRRIHGTHTACFQLMYRGLRRQAMRAVGVRAVIARVVYERDRFAYDELAGTVELQRCEDEDPGPPRFAVAVARDGLGVFAVRVLSWAAVLRHRDRYSDSYRRAEAGRRDSAWHTSPEAMAEKTALRQLMRDLNLQPEDAGAVELEDRHAALEAEPPQAIDVEALTEVSDLTPDGPSEEPTPQEPTQDLDPETKEALRVASAQLADGFAGSGEATASAIRVAVWRSYQRLYSVDAAREAVRGDLVRGVLGGLAGSGIGPGLAARLERQMPPEARATAATTIDWLDRFLRGGGHVDGLGPGTAEKARAALRRLALEPHDAATPLLEVAIAIAVGPDGTDAARAAARDSFAMREVYADTTMTHADWLALIAEVEGDLA